MRDRAQALAIGLVSLLVGSTALADGRGVAARCRAALKRSYAHLLKESKTPTVLIDVPGGVELQAGYATGKTSQLRGIGRCVATEMSLGIGVIPLPAGWLAVDGQGTDSHVGVILDAHDHELLKYDIGAMAGSYAAEEGRAEFTWLKADTVAGQPLHYGRKKRELYMTLGQNTNFWGPAATDKEMAPLLAFVRGMKPLVAPPKGAEPDKVGR